MGLLKAFGGALGGTLADQWREYIYCDTLESDVLVRRGRKRVTGRSSNVKGDDNLISNGSVVAVNEGQCMMIVDQGKVVELCAEPGEFTYDASTEPSLFYGSLGKSVLDSFKTLGRRFTFGGDPGRDQRVYFFNTKEIVGNKYGTPNPVPFRVVDRNIGLDIDIAIRCHGEYSYKITDPMLFYANVCGNVADAYRRSSIDGQLKSELMTALQPAFARISALGIRYSALPGHTMEIAQALNDVLSQQWAGLRGIEVAAFGINSVTASDEDEAMIKELQRTAVLRNPGMAAATMVGAQAQAMQDAARNEATGPMFAFAGMNMANQTGGLNANQLFAMDAAGRPQEPEAPAPGAWTCACGRDNTGNFCTACGAKKPVPQPAPSAWVCPQCGRDNAGRFCTECGAKKPEQAAGWTCERCGVLNKGRFCTECGAKKPAGARLYRCDKCGWEPEDPERPPKFCPECGDRFDDADAQP